MRNWTISRLWGLMSKASGSSQGLNWQDQQSNSYMTGHPLSIPARFTTMTEPANGDEDDAAEKISSSAAHVVGIVKSPHGSGRR